MKYPGEYQIGMVDTVDPSSLTQIALYSENIRRQYQPFIAVDRNDIQLSLFVVESTVQMADSPSLLISSRLPTRFLVEPAGARREKFSAAEFYIYPNQTYFVQQCRSTYS